MSHLEVYPSALNSDRFEMVALGSIVVERAERASLMELPALSVGKLGVTAQLEGVAKQNSEVLRKVVRKGDLVINSRADRKGAAGLSLYEGSVSPVYSVMIPKAELLSAKYGHFLLRSVAFQEEFFRWGTGIVSDLWSTNFTRMARIRVPLPPLTIQNSIASYLDRETAEIDAMLATLEELTETLRLRRVQAIQSSVRSSRSVGIGLMLDVKLGKMLQTKPKTPTDRLQPYLRAAHIQPGGRLDLTIDTKEMYFSEPEAEALSLRAGDAVIVEGGAGFGRAAYLTEDMPGWGFQNSIIRLRGASSDTRYAVYALQAALDSGEIAIACNAATFAHFTAEKVEGFRIPYHGTDEHRRIADHLDEVTGRIDAMLATIDELKALLVERRAALITDVVTGRKKVPA